MTRRCGHPDMEGRLIDGAPGRKASSEILMHLMAIAIAPMCTPWCTPSSALNGVRRCRIPLDSAVLAEVVTPRCDSDCRYATPSRRHCRQPSSRTSRHTMRCCSPITARWRLGPTCSTAYYKMETIEHFARTSLVERMLAAENTPVARRSGPAAGAAGPLRHRVAGACVCGHAVGAGPRCRWWSSTDRLVGNGGRSVNIRPAGELDEAVRQWRAPGPTAAG